MLYKAASLKVCLTFYHVTWGGISVVDPNTLNLDPDPEFWPFGLKIILEKIFFFNYKKIMAPEELFIQSNF